MLLAIFDHLPIKFFGVVDNSSPHKRRKIDGPEVHEPIEVENMDQDPDECVESMPGFHEHDERIWIQVNMMKMKTIAHE